MNRQRYECFHIFRKLIIFVTAYDGVGTFFFFFKKYYELDFTSENIYENKKDVSMLSPLHLVKQVNLG